MYKPFILARSKLKNFAPKILLCAQLIVLSVRNANIVFGGSAEELGILNFEFLLRQAAKPSGELFSASPAILNYSVVNYSRQGKLKRLCVIRNFVLRRVLKGHVSIRNPLQAPKERSCGINNPPHPNLVPRSGTDYHPQHHTGCVSPPSGNYIIRWR